METQETPKIVAEWYATRAKTGPKAPTDPIRTTKEIDRIKEMLKANARDYAMFVMGINTAFRAGDLLALNLGDVRGMELGDDLTASEQKTTKRRTVTMNQPAMDALSPLLEELRDQPDAAPLFQTKDGDRVTVLWLGRLVKKWCAEAKCKKGNYSSHTLRKTFGYTLRVKHKVPLELLQDMYGHSSGTITLKYVAIQPEELKAAYMLGV
jgi:integrase